MDRPEITLTTPRLFIRPLEKSDKDCFMKLRTESVEIRSLVKYGSQMAENDWREILKNQDGSGEDFYYVCAFFKHTGEGDILHPGEGDVFIGSMSVQNYGSPEIALGFDVVEEYRNQGYGTEMAQAVIGSLKKQGAERIFMKARNSNTISRHVIEKCGGVYLGEEPQKNKELVDEITEKYGELWKMLGDELPDDVREFYDKMNESLMIQGEMVSVYEV